MDKIDTLTAAVDQLSREGSELRGELRRRTRVLWGAIGVGAVLFVALILGVVDNSQEIEENNLKLCPIVTLMVPKPGDSRSTTPRGQVVAERATRLAKEYHCGTGL